MAQGKKSFVLYCDLIHTIKKMEKEKAGELFLTILEYVNDNNPIIKDSLIDLVFEPIKQQFKRDLIKYNNICDRNKNNGLKGGRPSNQKQPKKPSRLITNPKKPKEPDTDTDSDNEKEKDIKQFDTFWNDYHAITKLSKSDKEPTKKHWDKLTNKEKEIAILHIQKFYDSLKDKNYCKKARTYLSDKNFNDEFKAKGNLTYKPNFDIPER